MSILKNIIPILEFDTDGDAVIMPGHEQLGIKLPEKAVFAFLGDAVDRYAEENDAVVVSYFESATKNFPAYILNYQGEEICLMQAPVGAAAAVQILDWLAAYGVKKVISSGSCGALQHFDENVFLVPCKALRDEGTSYHYAAPSRFIDISSEARMAIEKALTHHGLKYKEVVTWSTDGFFRETREKTAYRISEGCEVVEMECSALAACAQMRGIVWGELLYTADTLADTDQYDQRGWGKDSVEIALKLSLDAVYLL